MKREIKRQSKYLYRITFYTFSIISTLFFSLMDAAAFSEWWTIYIDKDTNGYPFGESSSGPWYYFSSDLYSTVMLIDWIVYTSLLTVTIFFLVKNNRKRTLYSLLACLAYFVTMFVLSYPD